MGALSKLSVLALSAACAIGATSASALDLTNLSATERDALRSEFRAYLLDNPEVLIEAMDVLEEKRTTAMMSSQEQVLFADENSWIGGNLEGDIRLVEFVDYRCGYCKRVRPEINAMVAADGNVQLIRKEFPILGEASVAASRFAIATRILHGDAAYEQISDALMEAPSAAFSEPLFKSLSDQYEYDWDQMQATMSGEEVTNILIANQQLAAAMDIRATPSFVLEDKVLSGALPRSVMEDEIAAARARKDQ